MKPFRDQHGAVMVLELVLIIMVLGAVVVAGVRVYRSHHINNSTRSIILPAAR